MRLDRLGQAPPRAIVAPPRLPAMQPGFSASPRAPRQAAQRAQATRWMLSANPAEPCAGKVFSGVLWGLLLPISKDRNFWMPIGMR
jgi:hypothetical protein